MAPKKTIADEIKKYFSRYFIDEKSDCLVCKIEWTPERPCLSTNIDDEVFKMHNERTTLFDPLNGLTEKVHTENDRLRTISIVQTEKDDIQLSFDRQKEDDNITGLDVEICNPTVQENIVRYDLTEELLMLDGIGESSVEEAVFSVEIKEQPCLDDFCNHDKPDVTIENLVRDFASLEYSTDKAQQDAQHEGNQQIGSVITNAGKSEEMIDIDQKSTVSDELSKYIRFYEKRGKECTSSADKEIEFIVGTQQVHSIVESSEDRIQDPLIIVASDAVGSIGTTQDGAELTESINDLCIFDSMYEAVQDANDPTLFTIRLKTSSNLTNISVQNGFQTEQTALLFDSRKHQVKPCSVLLKDFLFKHLSPNSLAVVFANEPQIVTEPTAKQSTKKPRSQKQPATNKKKKSAKRVKNVDTKNKDEIVVIPPAPSNRIKRADAKKKREISGPEPSNMTQKAAPKRKRKIAVKPTVPSSPIENPLVDGLRFTQSPPENTTILIEEKTVSINEWLQESSQVQPDNNVDVNEFLQDVNFPVLSDIVSSFAVTFLRISNFTEANEITKY